MNQVKELAMFRNRSAKNSGFFRGFFTFQVMKPARFCKLKCLLPADFDPPVTLPRSPKFSPTGPNSSAMPAKVLPGSGWRDES